MEYCHYGAKVSGDRESNHLQQRELEKDIILSTSSRLEGKARILRASDVLLSLVGRSITSNAPEPSPAVENFQEALRLFPPFRDDDGTTLGALEVKCPDCEAVFSSSSELKQHYLTRYCAGSAVAVYVMTRDRLITKGYRMEKRLIPLDSRPIRFFCNECERPFALSHDGETIEREQDSPCFVDCIHCGSKCNILYEPILNDPRDDISYRDVQKDIASANHSRSPSIVQKNSFASKIPTTDYGGEQTLAKKARKLRDSWTFRKISQSDEEELLAISFAGLYDLERIHAPNGLYQPLPAGTEMGLSESSFCSNGFEDTTQNRSGLCEDERRHHNSDIDNSEGELIDDREEPECDTRWPSKRQSFFQKIFGRKVATASNRGKKLMKRANTIRFSFVTRYSRSESRAVARDSPGSSEEALAQEADEDQNNSSSTVQDTEYIALLRGTQNVFVHLQHVTGGAIVHDVSGRQRILQVDEVAKLFLQMKNEHTQTAVWSRALAMRLRAEALLKQGNSQGAVVEFHNTIKILEDTPGLDIEKLTKAGILHTMGQAYRRLDLAAEAESCYLESLGLYKRVLGRDHPKNFAVLHDFGSLCEKDGYATEAAALYERSFAGRLKTLGHNAPETLSSMQDLASLKVLLGDLESSLLLLEKAVPALDTVFGIQHATTLNAMNKLSLLYQKLGLAKESRTICGRTIPHCRTVFGLNSSVTRDAVVRYLQSSENFDFPQDIRDILDSYKRSRDADCLRVIHRLGRSYMDAGLNRDAANLFESLVEDFLAVKGPEAPETFDALSALCVSREHLDSVDKAILAYSQLVQMAKRTPDNHHSRKRIGYAEKRILELNRRREILESEKKEWGLYDPKPCENCGNLTTILCSTCKITPLCSTPCAKKSHPTHKPTCIPSLTLRESKSLAVKLKCPISARDQALSRISHSDNLTGGLSMRNVSVTASYTLYLDPRNFATFRMRLGAGVNTVVVFSLDCDVEYMVVTGTSSSTQEQGPPRGRLSISKPTTSSKKNSLTSTSAHPHPQPSITTTIKPAEPIWLTPQTQDSVTHIPIPNPHSKPTSLPRSSQPQPQPQPQPPPQHPASKETEKYILVKPGKEMHKALLEKRASVRAGIDRNEADRERERNVVGSGSGAEAETTVPSEELIEYAQGLLLTGYLGEVVMYVVEWVWK
ncbi:hypothetical protein BJX70DRAFT_363011 [Aspergillus crustosus]